MSLTRRWFLQALSIGGTAVVAAAQILPVASDVVSVPAVLPDAQASPPEEPTLLPTRRTELESYLRRRGVKPATLARECGYARQHLLRVRYGRIEPSPDCAVAITYALRRLAREGVVLGDVFPATVVAAAWVERRRIVRRYHPFQHRSVRAVFRRRS